MPLRTVRLRVHAPVPGHIREFEEAEAFPDVLVPRHRQGQKEDVVL